MSSWGITFLFSWCLNIIYHWIFWEFWDKYGMLPTPKICKISKLITCDSWAWYLYLLRKNYKILRSLVHSKMWTSVCILRKKSIQFQQILLYLISVRYFRKLTQDLATKVHNTFFVLLTHLIALIPSWCINWKSATCHKLGNSIDTKNISLSLM